MRRFNVYDNRDGAVVALNEYAATAEDAIKQVVKRTRYRFEHLRAESPTLSVTGF